MKEYDKDKPSKYIAYVDENNVYGGVMMDAIAFKEFKWMANIKAL
jgi:hypothetical protein